MAEGGELLYMEWLERITEDGRKKLEKATVVSVDSVRFLSLEEILEIRLGVGDRGVFRAYWQSLQVKEKEPVQNVDPVVKVSESDGSEKHSERLYTIEEVAKYCAGGGVSIQQPLVAHSVDGRSEALAAARGISTAPAIGVDVTSQVLAKDRILNKLASQYAQGSILDTLSLQDLNLLGGNKGVKVLLPINFCTVLNGCSFDEEEILGCGSGAGKLVWQSGKNNTRRPTPERLSFGQFFEGRARIQNLLLLNDQQKVEYLDYLRQLGILLQTFVASTVFCLDHLHRHYIFETGKPWNVIENTLQNSVLRRREDAKQYGVSTQQPRRDNGGRVTTDKGGKPLSETVCYLFNLHKGCPYGDSCIYPHVCSVGKCRAAHPAYKHFEFKNRQDSQPKSSS